jgi:hypothetical protein
MIHCQDPDRSESLTVHFLFLNAHSINKTTSIPHAGRRGPDDVASDMHMTGLGLARGLLGRGGRRKEKKEAKGLLPL